MEKLKNIGGALFDLDGTLLDSTWLWEEIDRSFLFKRGINVPKDYAESVNALGFRAAAEYTIKRFELDETPESLIADWNETAVKFYTNEVKLKPGAKDYLLSLLNKGVKLGIVTALSEELYIPCLKNNAILTLFDVFVSLRDDLCGKEVPDAYLKGAKGLGLRPCECAVFEDIAVGIESAKRAGFITVGVFDKFSQNDSGRICQIADYYIKDFTSAPV